MNRRKSAPGTTVQVACRVAKDVGDELQRIADEEDRSLSYVAGRVLQRWYNGNKPSDEGDDEEVNRRAAPMNPVPGCGAPVHWEKIRRDVLKDGAK